MSRPTRPNIPLNIFDIFGISADDHEEMDPEQLGQIYRRITKQLSDKLAAEPTGFMNPLDLGDKEAITRLKDLQRWYLWFLAPWSKYLEGQRKEAGKTGADLERENRLAYSEFCLKFPARWEVVWARDRQTGGSNGAEQAAPTTIPSSSADNGVPIGDNETADSDASLSDVELRLPRRRRGQQKARTAHGTPATIRGSSGINRKRSTAASKPTNRHVGRSGRSNEDQEGATGQDTVSRPKRKAAASADYTPFFPLRERRNDL